jgi:hypothetical protein
MYSNVSGATAQKDHAEFAEKELLAKGFTDWEVVVANEDELQLDYDDIPFGTLLPKVFPRTLDILTQAFDGAAITFKTYASKGGRTHVIVKLPHCVPIMDRVAWQAAFGSDPIREALHICSIRKKELNPILLFMHKRRGQKLLPAVNGSDERKFRTEV